MVAAEENINQMLLISLYRDLELHAKLGDRKKTAWPIVRGDLHLVKLYLGCSLVRRSTQ